MTNTLSASLMPVPVGPPHDGNPASGDPRLAAFVQALASALVAALSPWLAKAQAALNRLGNPPAVLLSADDARAYCGGLAKSTWCDFDQRGVIPAPVRIGGRVLWRRADLDAWVERSCPGRARFEESMAAQKPSAPRGKHTSASIMK